MNVHAPTALVDRCGAASRTLLTIEEARERSLSICEPITGMEVVGLRQASGRVLAEALTSKHPLPPFDNSAVDGYGLALGGGTPSLFTIVGRVAAGQSAESRLLPGQAVRIFTGAPVPEGCDAVVMQEKVDASDGCVRPLERVEFGENIRREGEDVARMQPLLDRGTRLDARHAALLAAAGVAEVRVTRPVRVAIMSTGDELREPDECLPSGAIHDSNRFMLMSLLRRPDVECLDYGIVPDRMAALTSALGRAADETDLIIVSGGICVGEEDHTRLAVAAAGGVLDPLQIAIKPGKPLALGRIGSTIILGLPGNPLAALTGYLLIGRDILASLSGSERQPLKKWPAKAAFRRTRRLGRSELIPARIVGQNAAGLPLVEALGKGGSARLMPLSIADGICIISPDEVQVEPGTDVEFISFRDVFGS